MCQRGADGHCVTHDQRHTKRYGVDMSRLCIRGAGHGEAVVVRRRSTSFKYLCLVCMNGNFGSCFGRPWIVAGVDHCRQVSKIGDG